MGTFFEGEIITLEEKITEERTVGNYKINNQAEWNVLERYIEKELQRL